ncbi:MAG: SDR family NAD(P)-dependent oxidoreductase, partial [Synechococcaceae cyanobacterium]
MSTVLITGANRGIGLEFCRQLQARGDAVVAVCRTPSPELEQLGVRIEAGLDLTDAGAGEELRRRLGDLSLDLLIHNAGRLEADSLESVEAGGLRRQFEVNAIAPLLLSRALLPLLHPGSKLVLI